MLKPIFVFLFCCLLLQKIMPEALFIRFLWPEYVWWQYTRSHSLALYVFTYCLFAWWHSDASHNKSQNVNNIPLNSLIKYLNKLLKIFDVVELQVISVSMYKCVSIFLISFLIAFSFVLLLLLFPFLFRLINEWKEKRNDKYKRTYPCAYFSQRNKKKKTT